MASLFTANGCTIWDLNEKNIIYVFNGIGTNVLGYSNKTIDRFVISTKKATHQL